MRFARSASELGAGVPDPLDEAAAAALAQSKRRMMGIVMLIGELFQRRVLGFKIVNDVVVKLVISEQVPPEHSVECFLQLIATVGEEKGFSSVSFGHSQPVQGESEGKPRLEGELFALLACVPPSLRRFLYGEQPENDWGAKLVVRPSEGVTGHGMLYEET